MLHHRKTATDYSDIETLKFIRENFDKTVIQALLKKELAELSSIEKHYFTSLEAALGMNESDMTLPQESLFTLQEILDATFPPDGGAPSKIVSLLGLTTDHANIKKLTTLQTNISGHFLAKKINAYFDEPESTRNQARLNGILPNIAQLSHWRAIDKATEVLRAALKNLTAEQQTQVLISFFTQSEVSSDVAKDLFGDSSSLEFKVMLDVMTALSTEQMAVLVDDYNALFVLRTLLYKYEKSSSREPKEFLSELPEEMLDKLMPQIRDKSLQSYLDDYHLKLEELPKANTPDWQQTTNIIASLFAKTKTKIAFIKQLRSAASPRELKVLLLLEISAGDYYQAQNMVAIALKRLSEHEAAIEQSLAPEDRRWHIQLKTCGALGKCLAIELECLLQESRGTGKLNQLKDALNHLPEKISEAELYGQLRDTSSPLSTALFTPVAPVARGFTLFEQKRPPEPDMAFLREINERLERLDQTLAAGVSSQSLTNRGT